MSFPDLRATTMGELLSVLFSEGAVSEEEFCRWCSELPPEEDERLNVLPD